MFGLALRGLASRKLRAALTALAIMLGVAMVAGTFMLKGSVDKAFDDIFAEANAGIDVTVQPKSAFDTGFDLPESGAALHESLVRKVESVDGVEKAAPAINDSTSIAILDENGDHVDVPEAARGFMNEANPALDLLKLTHIAANNRVLLVLDSKDPVAKLKIAIAALRRGYATDVVLGARLAREIVLKY